MFRPPEEVKIMSDFKINDKISVTNIHRCGKDPQAIECRAVVILNMPVAIEYTQWVPGQNGKLRGHFSSDAYKAKDRSGREVTRYTSHIQIPDPTFGTVTKASFGLTRALEDAIAEEIDGQFTPTEDESKEEGIDEAVVEQHASTKSEGSEDNDPPFDVEEKKEMVEEK